jgi:hypothetical protein
MSFDQPAPDISKLMAAWEAFESGEELPGKVLANLKTAGLAQSVERARRIRLDALCVSRR